MASCLCSYLNLVTGFRSQRHVRRDARAVPKAGEVGGGGRRRALRRCSNGGCAATSNGTAKRRYRRHRRPVTRQPTATTRGGHHQPRRAAASHVTPRRDLRPHHRRVVQQRLDTRPVVCEGALPQAQHQDRREQQPPSHDGATGVAAHRRDRRLQLRRRHVRDLHTAGDTGHGARARQRRPQRREDGAVVALALHQLHFRQRRGVEGAVLGRRPRLADDALDGGPVGRRLHQALPHGQHDAGGVQQARRRVGDAVGRRRVRHGFLKAGEGGGDQVQRAHGAHGTARLPTANTSSHSGGIESRKRSGCYRNTAQRAAERYTFPTVFTTDTAARVPPHGHSPVAHCAAERPRSC